MKFILLALLLLVANRGTAATLLFTAPSTGQHVWVDWDPVLEDSVLRVECNGTQPIHDILTVYLWKQLISGGPAFIADSQFVAPDIPDSFPNQGPGHYYINARNSRGISCASNQVTILPGVLTSVEVQELQPLVISCDIYDVQGRRVGNYSGKFWYQQVIPVGELYRPRLASGVYWIRGRTTTGQYLVKTVVITR